MTEAATTVRRTGSRRDQEVSARYRRLGLLGLRAGAIAASLSGLVAFVINPILGRFNGDFEDYRIYRDAATALTSGGDIYAPFLHQPANVQLTGFDYPPLVAWVLQPLAWLPPAVASTLWILLLVACTAAASVLAVKALLPAAWPRYEIAVLLTFVYAAATYNYWHGNLNSIIVALLAFALVSWMDGRQVRTGVLIGIAASIKLAPVVLLILLVRARWWRGTAAALVTISVSLLGGALLVGTGAFREWLTGVLPVLAKQDGWLTNQSINGTINRVFDHSVLTPQAGSALVAAITLVLAVGAVAPFVVAASPRARTAPERGAQFGIGVLVMLLAGSLAWYAHFVSALIPAVAATALLLHRPRDSRERALLVVLMLFVVVNALIAPVLIALVGSWTTVLSLSHSPWWYELIQVASLPSLSACALLVAMAVVLQGAAKARRREAPA